MTISLEGEILSRGLDDIIQLAELVSIARFEVGVDEGPQLFDVVEVALCDLVEEGLARIGDLDDSHAPLTVVPWVGDVATIVGRAISAWRTLGREPNLAEVCWLELTPLGRQRAKEMFSAS